MRLFRSKKRDCILPNPSFQDDWYLVSFPRSGVTWLSFMMAHCHSFQSGLNVPVNFYNLTRFIPDVMDCRDIREQALPFPGFRVIKSHADYQKSYRNVFYLLRDPLETMTSYHRYRKAQGQFDGTLEEFVRSEKYGLKTWVRHVNTWLVTSYPLQRIVLVYYRDIQKDPAEQLKKMYGLLGLSPSPDIIDLAVKHCSLDGMGRMEEEFRQNNPSYKRRFQGDLVRKTERPKADTTLSKDLWQELIAPYRTELAFLDLK